MEAQATTETNGNIKSPYAVVFLFMILAALGVLYPELRNSTFNGSHGIHTAMEMFGSLPALIVGAVLIRYFYCLGNRFFLLVGLAFFINGALDLVHGLFSLRELGGIAKTSLEQLLPATYVTG
ncbi:MAG: hypothetical protein GY765_11700, partial [bacterium]|nr:hypothetical protein [bacterium]